MAATALAERRHLTVTPLPEDINEHAETYRQAVRDERSAETSSIIAAWNAGHVFRAHEDPVHEIARLTGMSEKYVSKRIRLAGAYTKAALMSAIERSQCTHFTAFYSWTFSEGTHASNQLFPRRNVHVPQETSAYFESLKLDIAALLRSFLAVIPPSELHALIKRHVPEIAP